MGLKITYLPRAAAVKQVTVDRRLWVTRDGRRLVEDGHPDAGFLFCPAGQAVAEDEFNKYQLDVEAAPASEPEEQAGPEEEKTPKGKSRQKSSDKAVAGPEEEKTAEE